MASESEPSEIPSAMERLLRSRDMSLLLPFLFGFSNPLQTPQNQPDEENNNNNNNRTRVILINPSTQGMVVIEGSSGLDSLLSELESKAGPSPAAKSAIEALPRVEITRDCGDQECPICLDELGVGALATEMPCKHRFHGECIDKWLGIRGSCPVCRHKMPVEERKRRVFEREIWVSVSVNGRRSNQSPSSDGDEDGSSEAEG